MGGMRNGMATQAPPRTLLLEVALAPALAPAARALTRAVTYVVLDVVRATTSLCVLFERDCAAVLVAPSIEAARALRVGGVRALLAGEVGGLRPEGFDLGNSPEELAAADVRGRTVALATTNGTRALHACLNTGESAILTGALRNASAVARQALDRALATASPSTNATRSAPEATDPPPADPVAPSGIVLVCAGRGELPAYDDTLCAGYLVERIAELAAARGQAIRLGEDARIARDLARTTLRATALRDALASAEAAAALRRVGLERDLAWCADVDATALVPTVAGSVDGLPVLRVDAPAGA